MAAQTETLHGVHLIFKYIEIKCIVQDFSADNMFMEFILFLASLKIVLLLPFCFVKQRRQ